MIGGTALVKLGSNRKTEDVYYLINDEATDDTFIHDKKNNIDYVNANGHPFYKEIWEMEKDNVSEIASPQALFELNVFAFVQHCRNGFWQKVDETEFDMKFLVRKYNLEKVKIVEKHVDAGQRSEINKAINSTMR